jgi:hypothetical protein
MAEEKLEIPKCPICGEKHTYRLEVERTYIIKIFTDKDLREAPRPVKFTRIFICPTKNEKFQASFILYDSSNDRIKSVTVGGVIEDEKKQ